MIAREHFLHGAKAQLNAVSSLVTLAAMWLELPGWGKLANSLGMFDLRKDCRWSRVGTKTVRGKWHSYRMQLNLSDWSERQTYFLGRYHDLNTQLLIDALVHPGDRVVDVGANIGMLTLHAAWRVGTEGLVDAFEPNPICCGRIKSALAVNQIRQVRLHEIGLSDAADTLTLNILQNHTGMGTLAAINEKDADSVRVPVEIGDAILASDPKPITLVKVDVEGFEVRALRGMRQTLKRFAPIVTTEVIEAWLERAGSSAAELIELMEGLNYQGFGLRTRRRGLRHRLQLLPFPAQGQIPPGVFDVVWLPRGGPLKKRIAELERNAQ